MTLLNAILIISVIVSIYLNYRSMKDFHRRISMMKSKLDMTSDILYDLSNEVKDVLIQPIPVTASDFQIVASNLESVQDRLAELDLTIQNIQIQINKEIND